MAKLLKISKKTGKRDFSILYLEEMKEFLKNVSAQDLKIHSFYLVIKDEFDHWELENIKSFFSEEYLTLSETKDGIEYYQLNENLSKYERVSCNSNIKIRSFAKIIEKFSEKTGEKNIDLSTFPEYFELKINTNTFTFTLQLDYYMNILKENVTSTNADLRDINKMKSDINSVIKNQKYYYRRKNEK